MTAVLIWLRHVYDSDTLEKNMERGKEDSIGEYVDAAEQ
jgi:hypothetical protein